MPGLMASTRPSGWIKGIVREVTSGDTLVIASAPRPGAPEKRITLSSLISPKLGKRDGSTQDEPYAWASREFLRNLCIGKTCTFRVDYTLENVPGREFGSVFIGPQSENVAVRVVAEGWAKVRTGGGSQSPYLEQLTSAAEAAEAKKKGLWSKEAAEDAVRQVPSLEFSAQELLAKVGKGRPLPAIVEQVGNGSTLRVTLLDSFQFATVQVCGIQAPAMGRRPPPVAEGGNQEAAEGTPPQPFAPEAKHFTELNVLNREVRVVLQGVDKHDNLFGSIMYPSSSAPKELADLGLQLVERGLARAVEWGLAMMITGSQRLREAERRAKQAKAGIWHDYVPPASAGTKLSDKFTGTVVEIVSGDVICVRDEASGVERRVTLSSIKAPRMGGRDRPGEPYARESKEFLRQRLIGKEVQVSMEYSRKVPFMANGAPLEGEAAGERQLDFGSVHIKERAEGGQTRQNNVAELLLNRGLATVVKHRTDDERSAHYEALLEAEQVGMRNKRALHRKRDAEEQKQTFHVNDISHPGNASKAKQHLAFLTRGKQAAVVEAVLSGNRLKLYVEKEGILLAFSPSGVRTPQRPQPAGNGRPAVEAEPYWEEALAFTRAHCLQREVEVEIETADRGGSFLGTLVTKGPKPMNLGLALLSQGLAKLHPSFDPARVPGGRDLAAAEDKAKEKRLKVWENYRPASAPSGGGDAPEAANGSADHDKIPVLVTELVDATTFFVQKAEEPRVQWIEEQMQALAVAEEAQPPKLAVEALCVARFSADGHWYRARVEQADASDPICPLYDVVFLDYGNRERVKATAVQPIDAALAAVPPQAQEASLAFLKVKGLDDEIGMEAARLLNELAGGGKKLLAAVVSGRMPSAQSVQLMLTEAEGSGVEDSVNAKLLSAGLARFVEPRRNKDNEASAALQAAEQTARKQHIGMWLYGDPGEESDEEDRPKNAWGRR